jgi:hypothetical protein
MATGSESPSPLAAPGGVKAFRSALCKASGDTAAESDRDPRGAAPGRAGTLLQGYLAH